VSVPITRDGPYAAPYAYQLAASESWTALTISATFDGTGASGAFYPCCSIYTQDGKLVSRDFPSASVAAGASAEVTYHPFLRTATAQSAATGGVPSVATFYRSTFRAGDPPQTVAAGSTDNLVWPHAALPTDGSITGPIVGNVFAQYDTDCIAIQYLYVGWENGNYEKAGVIGTNSRDVPADVVAASNYMAADSPLRVDSNDWTMYVMPNAALSGDLLHAYAINGDTIARDINEAWLVVYLWPITGYNGAIPGWPQ
jgi:hypothetical protein